MDGEHYYNLYKKYKRKYLDERMSVGGKKCAMCGRTSKTVKYHSMTGASPPLLCDSCWPGWQRRALERHNPQRGRSRGR